MDEDRQTCTFTLLRACKKSADLSACEGGFHFSFPSTLCLLYVITNSFLFSYTPLLVRLSVRIYVVVVERKPLPCSSPVGTQGWVGGWGPGGGGRRFSWGGDPRASNLYFFTFSMTPQFIPKKQKVLKTPSNLKNRPRRCRSDRFLMFFRVQFPVKLRDLLNLLSCKKYNAKTSFLHIRAPPFRINFPL